MSCEYCGESLTHYACDAPYGWGSVDAGYDVCENPECQGEDTDMCFDCRDYLNADNPPIKATVFYYVDEFGKDYAEEQVMCADCARQLAIQAVAA